MIKKYSITVNGKSYDVEVEEQDTVYTAPLATTPATAQRPVAAQSAPATSTAPAVEEVKEEIPAAKLGKYEVTSPMPGTILKHLVSVGDKVDKNQPLMVLEAMKMENEIVAQEAGIVKTINILEGSIVKTGDVLATID